MRLCNRGPQGILQAVEWHAVPRIPPTTTPHTEANGRSEPTKIPPKAGMGQGPVTSNHAQQQPQTSQALYQFGH